MLKMEYNFNIPLLLFSEEICELKPNACCIISGICDHQYDNTVKPVLNGHSKIDKIKVLMTNGSLMKVKSIAECSPWSILQHF